MKGELHVEVELPSQLLGDQWRFDVRDAHMRWVATVGSNQTIELEPGIYRVSGVLEDGHEHQEILQVGERERSVAKFAASRPGGSLFSGRVAEEKLETFGQSEELSELQGRRSVDALPGVLVSVNPRFGAIVESPTVAARNELVSTPVEVTANDTVQVVAFTTHRWLIFVNRPGADWARVRVGDTTWRVSLPTAHGSPQRPSAELELVQSGGDWHLRANISPWRVVSSSMQQLLAERRVARAFEIADQAATLLLRKYEDSVGAMLGALLLHRMHQLERYRSWLDNLIKDFPWWSDAAILGALLDGESADRMQRNTALQRLIAASEKRPCFTESYAHLLDGLRRWRDKDSEAQREQTLLSLQSRYGTVDWRAPTFTHSD
jgi:hypothetical protein